LILTAQITTKILFYIGNYYSLRLMPAVLAVGILGGACSIDAAAAGAQDALSALQAAMNAGMPRAEAVHEALAGAVCEGAPARETTIALIVTGQDLAIADSELGDGLGRGALQAAECDAAGTAVARVVSDMGTVGLRAAFVGAIEAAGGPSELIAIANSDPTIAFGGVEGFMTGPVDTINPCDRPGCN